MSTYNLIFLVGLPGAGKTTFGQKLAKELAWDFCDTDDLTAEAEGMSIPEIFAEKGEDYFRRAEGRALDTVKNLRQTVVATGGGLPCFFDHVDRLNRYGLTVYLQAEPALIADRLQSGDGSRPLLNESDREKTLFNLTEKLKARAGFYEKSRLIISAEIPDFQEIKRFLRM